MRIRLSSKKQSVWLADGYSYELLPICKNVWFWARRNVCAELWTLLTFRVCCLQSRLHPTMCGCCFEQSTTQEKYKKTKEWVLTGECAQALFICDELPLCFLNTVLFCSFRNTLRVGFGSLQSMKCWLSWFTFFRYLRKRGKEKRGVVRISLLNNKSYLVDPASNICLSQRLSHACLSINNFILWNCVQLIKSVIIYLMVSYLHGYP